MGRMGGNSQAIARLKTVAVLPRRDIKRPLQNVVEGIAKIAFLTDTLSVAEGQKSHLAVLLPAHSHTDHAARLNLNQLGELLGLLCGQVA